MCLVFGDWGDEEAAGGWDKHTLCEFYELEERMGI